MVRPRRIELSSIQIERLIIHDIPKRLKHDENIKPLYSERESITPDGMRLFFKDKIIEALNNKKAFKICIDTDNTSMVPLWVNDIMTKEENLFIDLSKKIADKLLESQDGVNTAGILLVILCKIVQEKACVIMKLERDKGVQLKLNEETKSFDLQDVENLMLTQKTKIFKVALLLNRDILKINYDGMLTDYQIDMKAKKEIRTFFMSEFLGYKPFADPKFTTQKFYNLTRTFIDSLNDEIQKAEYIQDLNSYIQKNGATISAREFAEDYLKTTEHQNNYKTYIKEKNFSYTSAFLKDSTLIDNKIKKIQLKFANGISIVGDKGTFDNNVKLERIESGEHKGEHKAEVISQIKKVL